jgi:hypothetical protein
VNLTQKDRRKLVKILRQHQENLQGSIACMTNSTGEADSALDAEVVALDRKRWSEAELWVRRLSE